MEIFCLNIGSLWIFFPRSKYVGDNAAKKTPQSDEQLLKTKTSQVFNFFSQKKIKEKNVSEWIVKLLHNIKMCFLFCLSRVRVFLGVSQDARDQNLTKRQQKVLFSSFFYKKLLGKILGVQLKFSIRQNRKKAHLNSQVWVSEETFFRFRCPRPKIENFWKLLFL